MEPIEVFCEGCSSRPVITEDYIRVISPEKGKYQLEAPCPSCAAPLDLVKWLSKEVNKQILEAKMRSRNPQTR